MDVLKEAVWFIGPQVIVGSSGRQMIAKWLKVVPPEALLEALLAAYKARAADPLTYVEGCLRSAPKPVKQQHDGQWGMRVKAWEDKQMWPIMWGPKPGEQGCQCPPDYLVGN